METCRQKNRSGDKFSFPIMPIHDQAFEFGFITECSLNSPADHLFFNGKLLPHVFQPQPNSNAHSRSISRTSSLSSKDHSLMSSRSNSTNSRSSCCSSARTSTSNEASERRPFKQPKAASKTLGTRETYKANRPRVVLQYGSSQRWQFITPAPALKHQGWRKRNSNEEGFRAKRKGDEKLSSSAWFGKRLFRSFLSKCKECHAIKPSTRVDDVQQRNLSCTSF